MAYEYKEYPKWIKDKNGKDIGIANNAEEEVKLSKKEELKKSKSLIDKVEIKNIENAKGWN